MELFQIGILGLFGQLFDFGFQIAFRNINDIAAGGREYGRNGACETWQLQGFDIAAASGLFLPEGRFATAYCFSAHTTFDAFKNNLGIGPCLLAYACAYGCATQCGFKL
ncbi:hypothetical protein NM3173_2162, partial [Neisseria meningitidis NM3173]